MAILRRYNPDMPSHALHGAIEAGGTKFVCIVARDPSSILHRQTIATTNPEDTLPRVVGFFAPFVEAGQIRNLGLGCFGPVDLDPRSPTYGSITSTPKPGWQNTNIPARLREDLHIPVVVETDVNAAALGESTLGAGRGLTSLLYLTIGTGIGGGLILHGRPLHGLTHPEMGHIYVPHDRSADPFPGSCPFHGDCLEGLASGPALERRLGIRAESLPDDHPFWQVEAEYLAAALSAYILVLSPSRIVLGGGIMRRKFLFAAIRQRVRERLNRYIRRPELLEHLDQYVVPPELGEDSGVFGALVLSRETAAKGESD